MDFRFGVVLLAFVYVYERTPELMIYLSSFFCRYGYFIKPRPQGQKYGVGRDRNCHSHTLYGIVGKIRIYKIYSSFTYDNQELI